MKEFWNHQWTYLFIHPLPALYFQNAFHLLRELLNSIGNYGKNDTMRADVYAKQLTGEDCPHPAPISAEQLRGQRAFLTSLFRFICFAAARITRKISYSGPFTANLPALLALWNSLVERPLEAVRRRPFGQLDFGVVSGGRRSCGPARHQGPPGRQRMLVGTVGTMFLPILQPPAAIRALRPPQENGQRKHSLSTLVKGSGDQRYHLQPFRI